MQTWCNRPSLYAFLNARNERAMCFGVLCKVGFIQRPIIIFGSTDVADLKFTLTVSNMA
jgi:hypothetical protein